MGVSQNIMHMFCVVIRPDHFKFASYGPAMDIAILWIAMESHYPTSMGVYSQAVQCMYNALTSTHSFSLASQLAST